MKEIYKTLSIRRKKYNCTECYMYYGKDECKVCNEVKLEITIIKPKYTSSSFTRLSKLR